MRVFAIGDLHFAGGTNKTMDRFGDEWRNHETRIIAAWERIGTEEDLLIIAGDTSWATRLEAAMPDLNRIGRLKGTKILIKGNHDYWWETASRLRRALDPSIHPLQSSALILNRVAVAGTRGWLCPGHGLFGEEDERLYRREVGRLKVALESLEGRRSEFDTLIVALHFPPTNENHDASGFTDLIDQHRAAACVFGHLHGESISTALKGVRGETRYYIVSADAVGFEPAEIKVPQLKNG